MSNIIHSQAGQLAKQNEKISTLQQSLQEELTTAQARIADQVKTAVHLVTMMMPHAHSRRRAITLSLCCCCCYLRRIERSAS
jgi:hypothetical protein